MSKNPKQHDDDDAIAALSIDPISLDAQSTNTNKKKKKKNKKNVAAHSQLNNSYGDRDLPVSFVSSFYSTFWRVFPIFFK
jgi:hypothetical protein